MKETLQTTDYLIIGQGIAGTLLSYFLLKSGQKVIVIDQDHQGAASNIAAGIINPITGRRFVKSWMVDELLPFAKTTYHELEAQLKASFFHERNIVRVLFSAGEENDWLSRTTIDGFAPYMKTQSEATDFDGKIKEGYSHVELCNTAQLDMPKLIKAFQHHLLQKNSLIIEAFDYDLLEIKAESIQYKNILAKKIIFCQGYQSRDNPWFGELPFVLAKGEVLLVKIPNVNFKKMLKHQLFIVPLEDDLYWVGSSYEWKFENDKPSKKTGDSLREKLQNILEGPFEVVDHLAGIRPTVFDRRPLIGLHNVHTQLGVFNGLGTKGASLGPYWAAQFANFLIDGKELDREVDLLRQKKEP